MASTTPWIVNFMADGEEAAHSLAYFCSGTAGGNRKSSTLTIANLNTRKSRKLRKPGTASFPCLCQQALGAVQQVQATLFLDFHV